MVNTFFVAESTTRKVHEVLLGPFLLGMGSTQCLRGSSNRIPYRYGRLSSIPVSLSLLVSNVHESIAPKEFVS